jgi:hypothetical protein
MADSRVPAESLCKGPLELVTLEPGTSAAVRQGFADLGGPTPCFGIPEDLPSSQAEQAVFDPLIDVL